MPLYEYACDSCGQHLEVLQRFDDEPLTTCPACQGPLRKLVSAPAVQFKGSGWYVTDYGRGGRSSSSPTSSEGKGESAAASNPSAPAEPAKAPKSGSSD